jgi:hypothetical protein
MDLPSIDLHGLTKDDAISTVANFLNTHRASPHLKQKSNSHYKPVPVIIITGSGKHSHSGPVLRTAVEKYLQKREMNYVINRGKGSFTVDCASGIDLYFDHNQKVCTKVIIATEDEISKPSDRLSNWSSSVRLNIQNRTNSFETKSRHDELTSNSRDYNRISIKSHKSRKMSNKEAGEPHIRQLLEQSKLEHEERLYIQKMTDSELDEAIEKSKLFISSTIDLIQQQNEQRFLSHLEQERQKRDEEEQCSAIIELSRQMEEQRKKESEREEIALQRILQLSEQEVVSSAQQEDELLSEVIALSLQETTNNNHLHEEEDQMLQQALALSILEEEERRIYSDLS